jgi:hypothetical protein
VSSARATGSKRHLLSLVIAAAAALGIALVQPGLARNAHKVKQRDDVFLLPPPAQLRAMTLGYRSAATDLLWAQLVYQYGLHWQEKRAFPDVTRYIDGMLALEPDFSSVYLYVDTILVFTPGGGTEEDARIARRYLERGIKERPYDPQTWLHYGQFIAFLAPSFLKDKAEVEVWRKDGALALAKAVELGADADRALAATTILSKAGERKAAIQAAQRAYAMADDPETQHQLLFKLQNLQANQDAELSRDMVDNQWRTRWMFMSRGTTLLIGPPRSAAACAGARSYGEKACPLDWSDFLESSR